MDILEHLNFLGVKYRIFEHKPVFTVKESQMLKEQIPGPRNKNLFLRNKNKSNYYLITIGGEKRLDQNKLQKDLKESRLTFAFPEELQKRLKTTPGSVSPLNLIYNKNHDIVVIVDEDVLAHQKVYFHPGRNSATLELDSSDFKRFLEDTKNKIIYQKL